MPWWYWGSARVVLGQCHGGTGAVPGWYSLTHNWTSTFGDFAAFPRELSLAADGTFAQRFVPELSTKLRPPLAAAAAAPPLGGQLKTADSRRLAITVGGDGGQRGVQRAQRMLEVQGRELEIELTVTAAGEGCTGATTRWSAAISFLRSVAGEEETVLSIRAAPGGSAGSAGSDPSSDPSSDRTLVLNRSRSSWNATWPDTTSISAPLRTRNRATPSSDGVGGCCGGGVSKPRSSTRTSTRSRASSGTSSLHAFVDRSIIEVIADNATAITARAFPQRENSTAVMVAVEGEMGASAAASVSTKHCTITADFSVWLLGGAVK